MSQAVDTYIDHNISRLRLIQSNQDRLDELRKAIRQKANGTFLWASLVIKELEEVESWEMMQVVEDMPTDLKAVYERMMGQIRHLKRGNAELCRKILSTVLITYRPLILAELGMLSSLPTQILESVNSVERLVAMCGSFLTIRGETVYFIHQSAKDFLSTEISQDHGAREHADIFKQSITAISELPKNIYSLTDFGFRPKSAQPPNPNPLDPMRYACLFWGDHFCDALGENLQSKTELALEEALLSFLKDHVLRWIESLCLLDRLTDGLHSVQRILQEVRSQRAVIGYIYFVGTY